MRRSLILALLALLVACVPGAPAPTPAPALPPIPRVTGPIALRVQYPSANALVAARDSTFLFGTVGTGDATLTVDGAPVDVKPNGAWLAWVPMPREPRWELVAVRGADTVRQTLAIRLPGPRNATAATGQLVV